MSSWLVQVMVSPTFTWSSAGVKVKLSMVTLVSSARACAAPRHKTIVAAMANRPIPRRGMDSIANILLSHQRRVDDRQPLLADLEVDAGNPEHGAKIVVAHFL